MTAYAYMLVGLPASGKTTFRKILEKMHPHKGWQIISLDDYIDHVAEKERKTYSEVFLEAANDGEARCKSQFEMSVRMKRSIIIDRTNLTKKSRAKWLKDIPEEYRITAVVMKDITEDELKKRLDSRPGKEITEQVLLNMKNMFEYPEKSEGFYNIYEWPQEINLEMPTPDVEEDLGQ